MRIIVTIGTGNSGCSAIHDFITDSTNYISPFYGHEFRVIDDPDGLINLYHNFYKNLSINNYSNSIMRFKNYINNLSELKMKVNKKGKKIFDKKIVSQTENFINDITILNYDALPQFVALQTNYFKKKYLDFKKNIFNSRNNNRNIFKMYLPVKEDVFFKKSKIFLNKLIKLHLKNTKSNKIILDQSVNILNYQNIFSFFDDVKIIIVTRDPRGIFNSMKTRQSAAVPGYDLKIFCKWYDEVMKKYINYKKTIDTKYNKNILEIRFEDFVKNFDSEQKKILKFIDTKKISNQFNVKKSKFNAFKAQKELSNFEQNFIKKKLRKYLQW